MTELRASLPKFKRQVQLGLKRIAATYYGDPVGFLVPIEDIESLNFKTTEDISLTLFRSELTIFWERLQVDLDCVFITYHSRRTMGFVSPRFISDLPISVDTEIARKLLGVKSEIFDLKHSENL